MILSEIGNTLIFNFIFIKIEKMLSFTMVPTISRTGQPYLRIFFLCLERSYLRGKTIGNKVCNSAYGTAFSLNDRLDSEVDFSLFICRKTCRDEDGVECIRRN